MVEAFWDPWGILCGGLKRFVRLERGVWHFARTALGAACYNRGLSWYSWNVFLRPLIYYIVLAHFVSVHGSYY